LRASARRTTSHPPFAWSPRHRQSAVGLNDRGEIAVGRRADLVWVNIVRGLPVVRAVWCAGERVA